MHRDLEGAWFAIILTARLALSAAPAQLWAQDGSTDESNGAGIYRMACLQCHGASGAGAPAAVLGFDDPLPDFSSCAFGTAEPRTDWVAVTAGGGPARGFSERMPAFGDALSPEQTAAVVDYLRTFCDSRAWPPGDLNFPRALRTEKAYPENEAVIGIAATTEGRTGVTNDLVFERRFGTSSQFELVVPVGWRARAADSLGRSTVIGGLGDAEVAVKHVLFHDNHAVIVSAAAAVVFPTGSVSGGFGNGTFVFESFVAGGAALPYRGFLQVQGGVGLPVHLARATREAFWRGALGVTLFEGALGRAWSPMVEALGSTELVSGAPTDWDVVPQAQVTLSARQHVRANVGVRVPMTRTADRAAELLAYLLWDFGDGALRHGWR